MVNTPRPPREGAHSHTALQAEVNRIGKSIGTEFPANWFRLTAEKFTRQDVRNVCGAVPSQGNTPEM